jgi:hypothetical protein
MLLSASYFQYLASDPAHTDRIIAQGQALARAIEALGTIEPGGPFGRTLVRPLLYIYKRRNGEG